MMSCMFRPFVAENRAFPALWSWHSPTDSANEARSDSANENHASAAHRIVAIGSQQGVVVFLSKERGFCFPSSRIDGQGRASPSLIGSLTQ